MLRAEDIKEGRGGRSPYFLKDFLDLTTYCLASKMTLAHISILTVLACTGLGQAQPNYPVYSPEYTHGAPAGYPQYPPSFETQESEPPTEAPAERFGGWGTLGGLVPPLPPGAYALGFGGGPSGGYDGYGGGPPGASYGPGGMGSPGSYLPQSYGEGGPAYGGQQGGPVYGGQPGGPPPPYGYPDPSFTTQSGFEGLLVPNTWYGLLPWGIEGVIIVIAGIIVFAIIVIAIIGLLAWLCGIKKVMPWIIKKDTDNEAEVTSRFYDQWSLMNLSAEVLDAIEKHNEVNTRLEEEPKKSL